MPGLLIALRGRRRRTSRLTLALGIEGALAWYPRLGPPRAPAQACWPSRSPMRDDAPRGEDAGAGTAEF